MKGLNGLWDYYKCSEGQSRYRRVSRVASQKANNWIETWPMMRSQSWIAGERTFQIEGTESAKGPKAENCYEFWETDNKLVICLDCSQPLCLDSSHSGPWKFCFQCIGDDRKI